MKTEGQKQSQAHEARIAELLNGTVVSGSGSSWSHDADVRAGGLLIEAKWTAHQSVSIKDKIWQKIYEEAWKIGRIPVMMLSMSSNNKSHLRTDLVVMDQSDFVEMWNKAHPDN